MKRFSIAFLLFYISSCLLAQTQFYDGFYVTRDNDTVYGSICVPGTGPGELPNLAYMQNRIMFINKDQIRYDVSPTKAFEVVFKALGREFKLVSLKNTIEVETDYMNKSSYLFFLEVIAGKVDLFQYFYRANTAKHQNVTSSIYYSDVANQNYRYCLRMDDDNLIRVQSYRFRKTMSDMFADHVDLAEKIWNKELSKDQIVEIVEEYNNWHKDYYNE